MSVAVSKKITAIQKTLPVKVDQVQGQVQKQSAVIAVVLPVLNAEEVK
jgi:hypothetical protein